MSSKFNFENYHEKLIQNLRKLKRYADVKLWVNGHTIVAHRCILSAGSKYFRNMLKDCRHEMPMRK